MSTNEGYYPEPVVYEREVAARQNLCPVGTRGYIVRSGETFYALASRFGVSLAELLAANPGIDPSHLIVGQTICIPGTSLPPTPVPIPIPCCTLLQPVFTTLPPGVEIPFGMVGVRAVSMSTRWYTFAAITLPDPADLGNFDSYVGVLNVFVEGNPQQPAVRTIRLVSAGFGNQPDTWAGAQITTDRPIAGETAEIRPVNTTTGVRGAAILRNDLGVCRG